MASTSGSTGGIVDKLPSTKDITTALENVKAEISEVKHTNVDLNPVGQTILTDTERVITDAERLLLEKNADDKLQKLLKEGQQATEELRQQASRLQELETLTLAKIDSVRLRKLAEEIFKTARMAGLEILSSSSFRRSCLEFIELASDVLGDVVEDVVWGGKQGSTGSSGGGKQVAGLIETGERQKKEKGKEKLEVEAETGEKKKVREVKETAERMINTGLEVTGAEHRVSLDAAQVEELYKRSNRIIANIAERERTKRVFQGLLEIASLIRQEGVEVKDETQKKVESTVDEITHSEHVKRTLSLTKELFEQFVGSQSLDLIVDHLQRIMEIVSHDETTTLFFEDLRYYLLTIFNEPDLLYYPDQETVAEGRRLITVARSLRYHHVFDELQGLLRELRELIDRMENDPATVKLTEDMKALVRDIMLDSNGNVVWKPEVMEQLRLIFMSSIIERLKIPVPAIHVEEPDMEFTLSNMVISLQHLVPEKVLIENRGKVIFDLSDMTQPELAGAGQVVRIILQNIKLHMPNADIWFRRKAFPKIEDEGKLKLDIGGRGMDITVVLRVLVGEGKFFSIQNVECRVFNLQFNLRDTKHDFLYNMLVRMFSGHVKNEIAGAVEKAVRNNLEHLSHILSAHFAQARTSLPTIATAGLPIIDTIKQGASIISQTAKSLKK